MWCGAGCAARAESNGPAPLKAPACTVAGRVAVRPPASWQKSQSNGRGGRRISWHCHEISSRISGRPDPASKFPSGSAVRIYVRIPWSLCDLALILQARHASHGYGPRPWQRATSASARSRSGRTFPASRGHRSVAAQGRSRSVPCRRRRRRSRATNPAISGGMTLRFGGRARASMSVARTLRFPDGPELTPLDQRPIETGHRHC
jgi:hypothetical protein